MKKLGGWTRIGIVISILWSLAVFGVAATEYYEFSKERQEYLLLPAPPKGMVIDSKAQAIFFEWRPVDLLAKGSLSYVRGFHLRSSRLFLAWLSPIIVLWVLSVVAVSAFKWVKAGFSGKRGRLG